MTINAALTTIARRELGYPVLVDIRDSYARPVEWEWISVIGPNGTTTGTAITRQQMLDHDGSICHLRRQTLDTLLAELHEQCETETPA